MLNLLTDNRALSSGSFWHLFCLSSLYFAQGLPVGFLFLALNTYFASKGASISEQALTILLEQKFLEFQWLTLMINIDAFYEEKYVDR